MTEDSTLAQAIKVSFESMMENIHTCLPGRVEKYEYSQQKANVKPLIKKVYLDNTVVDLPVLVNVPIVFPRTVSAGITFPINKGDGVLLLFSERALERWYSSGDDSEPGDNRKFDLSDAIAIPGLYSFGQANIASNNDDLEIHHSGQKVTIKKNGDIEIGNSSLKKVITDMLISLFNNHVHTGVTTGGGTSGVPLIPLDPDVTHKGLLTQHQIQSESV